MMCGRNPVLFFHVNSSTHEKMLFSASFISQVYTNVWVYFWVLDHMLAVLLSSPSPVSSSVQFSSVAQSCLTLCNPMNHSMPGLPVHHQLLEFTQTNVHRVSDAIQPSHPLSSSSPPAPNPSQPASQSFPMSQLFA